MIRAFIDASVLLAGCYSATGASREIIRYAIRGEIGLIISQLVLDETERNLTAKAAEALPFFHQLLDTLSFEVVRPSKREVQAAAKYTEVKDAPIVAAAIRTQVDYLTSLERQHLVGIPEVEQGSGLRIVLPAQLLAEIRAQLGHN